MSNPNPVPNDLTADLAAASQAKIQVPTQLNAIPGTLDKARFEQLQQVSHDGTSYTWSNHDVRQLTDALESANLRIKELEEKLATKYWEPIRRENVELKEKLAKAEKDRDRLDVSETMLIDERDRLEKLLDEVVSIAGGEEVCGEHSNLNCPWRNAIEKLATVEQERDALREQLGKMRGAIDAAKSFYKSVIGAVPKEFGGDGVLIKSNAKDWISFRMAIASVTSSTEHAALATSPSPSCPKCVDLREQVGKMEHMIGDVAVWALQSNWQSLSEWASSLKIEYNRDGTPFVHFTPATSPSLEARCKGCDEANTRADQVQTALDNSHKEILALRARCKGMEEALKFYGEKWTEDKGKNVEFKMKPNVYLLHDQGKIARTFLATISLP